MDHVRGILISLLAGTSVLLLMYGASTVDIIPTGKVSASLVNFTIFSQIVGAIVIIMAIVAIMHRKKPTF